MSQRSSMLDLVRRTCDDAHGMPDFEGVYEPDPEHVKAWEEPLSRDAGDKGKFVNLGPARVKALLRTATNPDDVAALQVAFGYWQKNGGYAANSDELGWVDRGEPRQAVMASSMAELAAAVEPVEHVTVSGSLVAGGMPSVGGPGSFRGLDVIDYGMLMQWGEASPLPETDDDWF